MSYIHLLPRTRRLTTQLEDQLERAREPGVSCDSMMSCDSMTSMEDRAAWTDSLQQVKAGLDSCVDCHVMAVRALKPAEQKSEIFFFACGLLA